MNRELTMAADPRLTVDPSVIQDALGFALQLAEEARVYLREQFHERTFSVETKEDLTPVTDADLATEKMFRKRLQENYPEHGIIGEEFPSLNPSSPFQWTLDPIDGTSNFARGIPTFGTLIGLRYHDVPIVGVIEHPAFGLRLWAGFSLGAFTDHGPFLLGDSDPSGLSIVATSTRRMFERSDEAHLLDRFMGIHSDTRIYYDCYAHSLVGLGSLDGMIEFNVRTWDLTPIEIITAEAGGRFQTVRIRPEPGARPLLSAVFGKPSIVEWLLPHFS